MPKKIFPENLRPTLNLQTLKFKAFEHKMVTLKLIYDFYLS